MDNHEGLIADPSQLSLIPHAAGFDIIPSGKGYKLVDCDTFNNWRVRPPIFEDVGLAEDHAHAINNFKQGRSMTIRDPVVSRGPAS